MRRTPETPVFYPEISFTLPKEVAGEQYAGKYRLKRLAGWQKLRLDQKYTKRLLDTKQAIVQTEFDEEGWSLELLQQSLIEAPFEVTAANLKELPPQLLDFLIEQATKLNILQQEERDFLLKLLRWEGLTQ